MSERKASVEKKNKSRKWGKDLAYVQSMHKRYREQRWKSWQEELGLP